MPHAKQTEKKFIWLRKQYNVHVVIMYENPRAHICRIMIYSYVNFDKGSFTLAQATLDNAFK